MEVWTWGANDYGQVGNGTVEDVMVPCKVADIDEEVVQLTGGGGHAIIVLKNGELRGSGWNKDGQLGTGDKQNVSTFVAIARPLFKARVIQVACGWSHTLAISAEHNALFGWGSNAYGQLGQSIDGAKSVTVPIAVASMRDVVDIACGMRHSIAVNKAGTCYGWGSNRHGQCGVEPTRVAKHSPTPMPLTNIACHTVVSVSAGANHTTIVLADGQVMCCGCNRYGQCGCANVDNCDKAKQQVWPLKTVDLRHKVRRVFCGWTHTIVVVQCEAGETMWSWGRCEYGQLGVSASTTEKNTMVSTPTQVQLNTTRFQLAVGSEHNLCLDDDGHVFSWGWNEHGMCAAPTSTSQVDSPQQVTALNDVTVCRVACGAGFSLALVKRHGAKDVKTASQE